MRATNRVAQDKEVAMFANVAYVTGRSTPHLWEAAVAAAFWVFLHARWWYSRRVRKARMHFSD